MMDDELEWAREDGRTTLRAGGGTYVWNRALTDDEVKRLRASWRRPWYARILNWLKGLLA